MKGDELARFLIQLVGDPSLFPIYDNESKVKTTFCNIGAKRNAPGESFSEFDAKEIMAEELGKIMRDNKSGLWKLMSGAEAALWAINGRRSMAFMSREMIGENHAHIARIFPKDMQMSGSLKHPVPWVANIGVGDPGKPLVRISPNSQTKPNWICKVSQAFPVSKGEPIYYGYTG